jgi:hypothetical protein
MGEKEKKKMTETSKKTSHLLRNIFIGKSTDRRSEFEHANTLYDRQCRHGN